jgi:hypothetical protein
MAKRKKRDWGTIWVYLAIRIGDHCRSCLKCRKNRLCDRLTKLSKLEAKAKAAHLRGRG